MRNLSIQDATLSELRSRTGTLVAAVSLVTSFLGGPAVARQGLNAWSILALLGFVVAVGAATWVLLPTDDLVFSISGSALLEGEITADVDELGETYRRLAYWLDRAHVRNKRRIARLSAAYRLATLAIAWEVICWGFTIALG